ncbi:hypothetical protein T492DRAFT_854135, partial [Pavlovales sp. CCMP2436]
MAARLMSASAQGETLGEIVCDEDNAYLQFWPNPPLALKGIDQPGIDQHGPLLARLYEHFGQLEKTLSLADKQSVQLPSSGTPSSLDALFASERNSSDRAESSGMGLERQTSAESSMFGGSSFVGRVAVLTGRQGEGKTVLTQEVAVRWETSG